MYLNAKKTFSQLNCPSKSTVNIPTVVLLLQTNKKSLTDQSVLPLGLSPPLFLAFSCCYGCRLEPNFLHHLTLVTVCAVIKTGQKPNQCWHLTIHTSDCWRASRNRCVPGQYSSRQCLCTSKLEASIAQ